MYLHEFFHDVYRLHRLRDASQNTIRLYGCTMRSFQKYLKRKAQLADLNDDTLSSFLSARSESVSSQTCRKEYDQLTSLWRYANRRQLVKTWPDLLPPKCQRRNPQALTLIQLRALCIAADEHSYEMGQLVRLAWQTGERKSALLAVRGYDLDHTFVTFRAETRKGSTEDNVCEISEELADSLAILYCPRSARRIARSTSFPAAIRTNGSPRFLASFSKWSRISSLWSRHHCGPWFIFFSM